MPAVIENPRPSLANLSRTGSNLPKRYVIHGTEGVGKTSLGAFMPSPVFLQSKGETGLDALLDSGQLEDVPHFPECETWQDAMNAILDLTHEEHAYKTLVIDTLNGVEKLCQEHICNREYKGNWGKKGFASFQQGYGVTASEWVNILSALDNLRIKRKMTIVALCHTTIKTFKNPEEADYDRYQPDMHHSVWSLTHRWADNVLFMNFEVFIKNDEMTRPKATGGRNRVLYTEKTAAYDAKNRMGLPAEIPLGSSASESWDAIIKEIKSARKGSK